MGPAWGLSMINMLKRLDDERIKLNYVIVGRKLFDALFFPIVAETKELVIGILLKKNGDPVKIYEKAMQLIFAIYNLRDSFPWE
jgi:hypothetical protein